MKKSELRKVVLKQMKGYSKYAQGGQTKGGTTADFRNILTAIAKGHPEEDSEEAKAERGNAILDKANPENVARISRGEKPIYEGGEQEYEVEYWYRQGDEKDFDTEKVKASSPEEAIEKVKASARRGAMNGSFKVV